MKESTRLERLLIEHIDDANRRWNLFAEGERILVGVSGGKDSLALPRLLKRFPIEIELAHVGVEADECFLEYCRDLAPLHIIEEDILANIPGRENPCFECAKRRRRRLLETARSLGMNRIALGHHKDDVVETLLLNMVFSREISTMTPRQPLFDGAYHIIRPMYLIPEKLIESYAKEQQLPVMEDRCPYAGSTKRETIRELIRQVQAQHGKIDVMENIFASMQRINRDFLPD